MKFPFQQPVVTGYSLTASYGPVNTEGRARYSEGGDGVQARAAAACLTTTAHSMFACQMVHQQRIRAVSCGDGEGMNTESP